MNRHYSDMYEDQRIVSLNWSLVSAILGLALLIACMQWGRTWARAVRAEAMAGVRPGGASRETWTINHKFSFERKQSAELAALDGVEP